MKELSIEEKAKRYDEALEAIKSLQEVNPSDEGIQNWVNENFPELKESEDERIIKALYKMAKVPRKEIYEAEGITKEQALAWLEKQGEQKPQGKTALEAINEEKVDNANKVEPREEELTKFEKAVKQVMEEAIECGDTHNLKADAEMLLSFVHNSSWSEEDEKEFEKLLNILHAYRYESFDIWLKSLKERHTWKPSDKQLKTLDEIIDVLHRMQLFGGSSALVFLKHDLMKLRGE